MEQYISYHFVGKYRWKFVLSVQQLSKADQQSISGKRWIIIRFQKVYLRTKHTSSNLPLRGSTIQ